MSIYLDAQDANAQGSQVSPVTNLSASQDSIAHFAPLSPLFRVLCALPVFPRDLCNLIAQYGVSPTEVAKWHEKRNEWGAAFPLYKAAYEEGDAEGAYKTGMCLLWGLNSVHIDEKRAVQIFQEAFSLGSVYAHSLLAQCYWNGWGVPEDGYKAVEIWSSLGDMYSQMSYGMRLITGDFDVGYDPGRSEYLIGRAYPRLLEAAICGDVRAQYQIACYLVVGVPIAPSDMAQAAKWFMLAAKQGHAEAQNSLSVRFERGYGLPTDERSAFHWMHQAASQGLLKAQSNFAYYLRVGVGCKKDSNEARKWYAKAAERGDPKGIRALEREQEYAQQLVHPPET